MSNSALYCKVLKFFLKDLTTYSRVETTSALHSENPLISGEFSW